MSSGVFCVLKLSFFVKSTPTSKYITNKNEKYILLSVRGMIDYIEDFDGCIQKRDEIVENLSKVFPNTHIKTENFVHPSDPSGDSIMDSVYFEFDSGALSKVSCINFEETFRIKNNQSEGLDVSIYSAETHNWLGNY